MNPEQIDELLQRTTFSKFMPRYMAVDGYQLGCQYNQILNDVQNFDVKDSDIWVCSYPKTGTTWTQEMVWLLINNFDYVAAQEDLNVRFPFLELESLLDMGAFDETTDIVLTEDIRNSVDFVKNLKTTPRCIKTHLPWTLLPKAIRRKEKRPRIIYVARNPKDTCVSYYHHHKLLQYYSGSFEEFTRLFLQDQVLSSPYWKHINSYWKQRHLDNVLFLKYEELKRNLPSVICRICKFLNIQAPQGKTLNILLKHLSFDAMKKNKAVDVGAATSNEGQFIRKGIIGDHKNAMSSEIEVAFDKWIKENNKFSITF